MPETVSLRLEEVSEDALKERIGLRKVGAAVDMYDQLLQAGEISLSHTHTHTHVLYPTYVTVNPPHHLLFFLVSPLAGTAVSMETTHDLLDLISFYCDRDPIQEGGPQEEDAVSFPSFTPQADAK